MGAANRRTILATLSLIVVVQAPFGMNCKECVPVKEVTALLFNQNAKTTSGKGQSASQLECMAGCDSSAITRVFCQKDDPSPDDVTAKLRRKLERFRQERKDMDIVALSFVKLIDDTPEKRKGNTEQMIMKSQEFVDWIAECRPGAIHLPKKASLLEPVKLIASKAAESIANLISWTTVKMPYCSSDSSLHDNDPERVEDSAKFKSMVDDSAPQWMCSSTVESHGKALDELHIICESCESQTWRTIVPGSCHLQYKQKTFASESDDILCRAISYAKKWGKEALEHIEKDKRKCLKSEYHKCYGVFSRLEMIIHNIDDINEIWNYVTSFGTKVATLVTWKEYVAVGVQISAAGINYSVIYCWDEHPPSNVETIERAHLKLI